MGIASIVTPWLVAFGAAQGTASPPNSLVVFGQEPVCHMGRSNPDSSIVRIEYHPQDDSYHLLMSGPTLKDVDPQSTPWVSLKSGFDRQFYRARIIPGNPDIPTALYVPLSYPQHFYGSTRRKAGRNKAIEQHLFDGRGFEILLGDKQIATMAGDVLPRATNELIKCSNKYAPNGQSNAFRRIARLPQ